MVNDVADGGAKRMSKKAISDLRILIWHIAVIAAAIILDAPMGPRVPGAENVMDARVVNAHATLRESSARRTNGTDCGIRHEANSTVASHP